MGEVKERGPVATGALRVGDTAAAVVLLPALIPIGFLFALGNKDGLSTMAFGGVLFFPVVAISVGMLGMGYEKFFGLIEDYPAEVRLITATAATWMLARHVSSRSKNYQEVWF